MKTIRMTSLALAGAILMCGTTIVEAQHHHGHQHQGPSYHIDHHNHYVRDSHGHVIGRYHHDVIHQDSTYVVPHTSHSAQHGSYYVQGGQYYYYPQTASTSSTHTSNYRPQQVSFGGFSHVDDLAARLETLTNDFCLDLHYNYSHNPGFQETYREAYQVLEVAKYIHAAEHQNDRRAIQEQLGGLDQQFHHIQGDVRGWSRHHHRQVGQLGILSKMDLIESSLHHLMNDVGVRQTPTGTGGEQAPPPAGGNIAPPPVGGAAPLPRSIGGTFSSPPPPTVP